MTRSFVHSLEIARDSRLAELRLPGAESIDEARRGASDKRAAGQPPPIGDKLRAAVDAGSILSFVSGLGADAMSDVLYSIQLAQRAASGKFDRFKATREWYGVYVDVLDRLGWAGEGFAFSQRDTLAGEFRMDRAALDVIAAVAAGGQLAILVKTLDALKTLGEGDRALSIFDLQAMSELSGNFQIGAAQKADNGATSLALGAFHFRAADNRRKFLFFGWGAKAVESWTAVSKLTLNPDLYAVHRKAVVAKLKADASDYIDALEIK